MRIILTFLFLLGTCSIVFAEDTGFSQEETQKLVESVLKNDLAQPWTSPHIGRKCLNGKSVQDFEQANIVEYWASFECPYCTAKNVIDIQSKNTNMCIILRHFPENETAMEKSLIYEALASQSLSAAKDFWGNVVPAQNSQAMSSSETKKMMDELIKKYSLDSDFIASSIMQTASTTVNKDLVEGMNKITYTPTFVIGGVRLSACDFNAKEMNLIAPLVQKAKTGDKGALKELVQFVMKEQAE